MAVGYGKEDSGFYELEARIAEQINKARAEICQPIANARPRMCGCGNVIPAKRVAMFPNKPCIECQNELESKSRKVSDRRGLYSGLR